jgi:hypothetical protein
MNSTLASQSRFQATTVTRDGRFIMLRRDSQESSLRGVIRWSEELKPILAAGGVR